MKAGALYKLIFERVPAPCPGHAKGRVALMKEFA